MKEKDEDRAPPSVSNGEGSHASSIDPAESQSLFLFEYAHKTFAVPLHDVERIIEVGRIESYPGDVAHCKGTIEFRGRVVPLFDPHGLCFGVDAEAERSSCVVIIENGGVRFGLLLERHQALLAFSSLASDPIDVEDPSPGKFAVGLLHHKGATLALVATRAVAQMVWEQFGAQSVLVTDGAQDAVAAQDDGKQFMVSRLGEMSIAHPLEVTLEIVEGLEVTPLFGVDPCLRGLISLRGRVLACIDVSEPLGLAPRVLDERSMFLVLTAEGADFALCVDAVEGLRALPLHALQPIDGMLSAETGPLFEGLVERGGVTHLCLSARAITHWRRLAPYRASRSDGVAAKN